MLYFTHVLSEDLVLAGKSPQGVLQGRITCTASIVGMSIPALKMPDMPECNRNRRWSSSIQSISGSWMELDSHSVYLRFLGFTLL